MAINDPINYLTFSPNSLLLNDIMNEGVLFSGKVSKRNDYNFFQERNLLITQKALYNFCKNNLKRRIQIDCMLGITVSSLSDEFVIHGYDNEYDYLMSSPHKLEIIKIIAKTYWKNTGLILKFTLMDHKSLKSYVTSKKEKEENNENTRMDLNKLSSINLYIYGVDKNLEEEIALKGPENLFRTDTDKAKITQVKIVLLTDFHKKKLVYKEDHGKVYIVEYTPTQEYYLLKEFSKTKLIKNSKLPNILNEKAISRFINGPFVSRLLKAFHNTTHLYFVSPYLGGLSFRDHINKQRIFDQEKAKFFSAQIIIALKYLHDNNIVYRNLKPENIWIDIDGYIKLVDYTMAVILTGKEQCFKMPTKGGNALKNEYHAPEIYNNKGHDLKADWWSFGIVLYEMLIGSTPFEAEDDKAMEAHMICNGLLQFSNKIHISSEGKDLIEKLLCKDPLQRLGSNGIKDITSHPFYANINFQAIGNKTMSLPNFTIPRDILEKDPDDNDNDDDEDEDSDEDNLINNEDKKKSSDWKYQAEFDRLVNFS